MIKWYLTCVYRNSPTCSGHINNIDLFELGGRGFEHKNIFINGMQSAGARFEFNNISTSIHMLILLLSLSNE